MLANMVLFTRFRHRHLMNDLYSLLPHSRKDAKLDTKSKLYQLNELADLYNCNNVFFFEARKGKDLYAWMSKAPNGPTVKMHLQNRALQQSFGTVHRAHQLMIIPLSSSYHGRAPLHGELPQRLKVYPLFRRFLRYTTTSPRDQRTPSPHFRRTQRRTKNKAVYRPCLGLYNRRRKDMDPMLPD